MPSFKGSAGGSGPARSLRWTYAAPRERIRMRARFGYALGVGVWLALGCAVGPDYERPVLSVPEKWRAEANAQADATLANVPWWELFKDEQLQALIKVALEQNRDLKIAVERIEEARATWGISKADLYPQLSLKALGGGLNPSDASLAHVPEGGGNKTTGLVDLGLGFSWEIDFFGRIRRAGEAA